MTSQQSQDFRRRRDVSGFTFDLVYEPWIPVVVGGRRREVSLLEALTQACEIDGLALDDPLAVVAQLRQVLMPAVLDACGAPRTEIEWVERLGGRPDVEKITTYFEELGERFDLFHPDLPFCQVAGLRTEKDVMKPSSLLCPGIATGNNIPLFSSRTEANPPALSPAEAARATVVAQCFDTAGIKSGVVGDPNVQAGKTTGNPVGPVGQLGVIIPIGRTLWETLVFNMPILPRGLHPIDRPQWRGEPSRAAWTKRPALGLLDLLTFQSRRIRLLPEVVENGSVRVSQVVLSAGDRLEAQPEFEPHTAWRRIDNPKPGEGPQRPLRHQVGRAAWRGIDALLPTESLGSEKFTSSVLLRQLGNLQARGDLPVNVRLEVLALGVEYGNQAAVIEDITSDLMLLPVSALSNSGETRKLLDQVVTQADELRLAANHLGDDVRRSSGGEQAPWDKGQRTGDLLMYQFDSVVRRLLAGLHREPHRVDEASRAWQQAARDLALQVVDPVLDTAPPTAFLGREIKDRHPAKSVIFRLSLAELRYQAALNRILEPAPGSQRDCTDNSEGDGL